MRLWNETMRDPGVPMQYRIRCSENLADRFGMPRESVLASMDDESPKLFEIARFEPPASMIEAHDGSGVEH